jgi:hypothetical protein
LQDPSEINGDNINNVRRENSRHFRNKKRQCKKYGINLLATTIRTRTSETCIQE